MVGPAPFCYGEREMAPDYLRTLFLHPPSCEGFDGGAGSRYQARREIRSFWYPTWLAQPAALVPGLEAGRRPSGRSHAGRYPPARAAVRPLRHAHEHAVLPRRRRGGRGAQGREPAPDDRHGGRGGGRRAGGLARGGARRWTSSRATSSTSPSRRWPQGRALRDVAGPLVPRQRARRRTRPPGPSSRTWISCRSSRTSTSAT